MEPAVVVGAELAPPPEADGFEERLDPEPARTVVVVTLAVE